MTAIFCVLAIIGFAALFGYLGFKKSFFVVAAIGVVFLALIVVGFHDIRREAQQVRIDVAAHHLKQVALAISSYELDSDGLPSSVEDAFSGNSEDQWLYPSPGSPFNRDPYLYFPDAEPDAEPEAVILAAPTTFRDDKQQVKRHVVYRRDLPVGVVKVADGITPIEHGTP